ncbi:hypothetical protein CC86DRAFT_378750 [Ophiobolus disseminans]|uniref:Uncharacterized protein n=1 Tax=Ophiobolus disseminans TaxID=1469910 RepID=A0A6A7ACQ9_9PLEO|nr:hypothetical protein CC86DRAFT_378750 [Ophiobolus disseminans]
MALGQEKVTTRGKAVRNSVAAELPKLDSYTETTENGKRKAEDGSASEPGKKAKRRGIKAIRNVRQRTNDNRVSPLSQHNEAAIDSAYQDMEPGDVKSLYTRCMQHIIYPTRCRSDNVGFAVKKSRKTTRNPPMARQIDQAKLPEYTGRFSLVPSTLKAYITAAKPDYNEHDPKTWQVFTMQQLRQYLGQFRDYTGYQLLLPYVAYDREAVGLCVLQHPDEEIQVQRADGVLVTRSMYFHHFPFVYNKHHAKRVISSTCMRTTTSRGLLVSLSDPAAEENKYLRRELAEAKEKLHEAKNHADAAEQTEDSIKRALREELAAEVRHREEVEHARNAEKEEYIEEQRDQHIQHQLTKDQLISAKFKHQNALEQAHIADRRAGEAEAVLTRRDEELYTARVKLNEQHQRAKTAEDMLATQAKGMQVIKEEAAAAKEEIITLRAQISKIRDEMKKAREFRTNKRKAFSDADSLANKRIKTEK